MVKRLPLAGPLIAAAISSFAASTVLGQDSGKDYVSRKEHEALKQRFDDLAKKLESRGNDAVPNSEDLNSWMDDVDLQLETLQNTALYSHAGTTKFLMSGYAAATYNNGEGSNSSFEANFNPIFIWKLSDNLLATAELEFELAESNDAGAGSSDQTQTKLEFLLLDWIVNDYLTIRGGKNLTPLSTFKE